MTPHVLPQPAAVPADTLAVDQTEAARLTMLSAKTLGRLADAGERVGRIKINRRVLYLRAELERWLAAKAAVSPHTPTS